MQFSIPCANKAETELQKCQIEYAKLKEVSLVFDDHITFLTISQAYETIEAEIFNMSMSNKAATPTPASQIDPVLYTSPDNSTQGAPIIGSEPVEDDTEHSPAHLNINDQAKSDLKKALDDKVDQLLKAETYTSKLEKIIEGYENREDGRDEIEVRSQLLHDVIYGLTSHMTEPTRPRLRCPP